MSTSSDAAPRDPRTAGLQLVGLLLAIMWATELVNVIDDDGLETHGIRPRDSDGLEGILFSPFLHADWGHLIGNSVPFVLFGGVIALSGPLRVAAVTAIGGLISGLGTWLVAPENSLHIGASGVVFAYGAYLISRGLFERSLLHLAVGAVVGVMYGSVLIGGLEPETGISWQGHLFGAVGGVVAAFLLSADRRREHDGAGAARVR